MTPTDPSTAGAAADPALLAKLRATADRLRVDIVEMIARAGSGHPGGSLSVIDLVVALYHGVMRHDPKRPTWAERDRLILSKGHAVPAVYATLADLGYFPREQLATLRQLGGLQGHPVNWLTPGIEAPTGSLGQGLSVAQGLALASKLDGGKFHVYCITGDGETQEGQVWEALMSAPKFGLDNLTVILDYNKGQIDGPVKEVMDLEPLAEKLAAFKWHVLRIDGHDMGQILGALAEAKRTKGRPTYVIADTVKGKGVSFMEHKIEWHGAATNEAQTKQAIEELRKLVAPKA